MAKKSKKTKVKATKSIPSEVVKPTPQVKETNYLRADLTKTLILTLGAIAILFVLKETQIQWEPILLDYISKIN